MSILIHSPVFNTKNRESDETCSLRLKHAPIPLLLTVQPVIDCNMLSCTGISEQHAAPNIITLMSETAGCSETSVHPYQIVRRHLPEAINPNNRGIRH